MQDLTQKSRFTSDELYTLMCYATRANAQVCYVRGKLCDTLDNFFREVSAALRFPDYFGWNWAAFDECLSDLEWLSFSEILIIIQDFDYIFKNENQPDSYRDLLVKYLNISIDYWRDQDIPIVVYLNQSY